MSETKEAQQPAPAPKDIVSKLRSLKVLLGADSPEVRGWAPAVQQQAQKVVNDAIAGIAAARQQQTAPLTHAQISHLWDTRVGDPTPAKPLTFDDVCNFARAIESAHGIASAGGA